MASAALPEAIEPKKKPNTRFAFACAILASMTSILLGYDIGVMSGASLYIQRDLKITDRQLEVLMGILNVYSLLGSFAAGRTSDWIGRRYTIVFAAAIFFAGAFLMGFAVNYGMLMFGRFVAGVGVGYALMIAPVYTAEVSPASSRGFLTSFPEVFINFGILLGYVSNYAFSRLPLKFGWRVMLGIGAAPSVVLALMVLGMPESPRWLVMKGRLADAKVVLAKTSDTPEEAAERLADIKKAAGIPAELDGDVVTVPKKEKSEEARVWKELILSPTPAMRRILLSGIGIHFFQQASGIDAVVLYSPRVFKSAGITSDNQVLGTTCAVGVTKTLFILVHLLTSYFSSQWHELVHVLLAHPKVDIFMDVAFDSLHEDVRLLSIRLSALGLSDVPVGSLECRLAHFICQQCETSLQFLLLLCQQKLFRDRILKNKELSRNGGILSLSHTILKLVVPECLKGSTDLVASVSRLKAKILSILLQLCEAESVSYLDEVATSPNSMRLGQTLALEVLNLLKTAFGRKHNITSDNHNKSYPMGSVLISALRLVDVFSDDSNFRSSFMTNTVPFLTQILAIPHDEFVLSWCSVNLPVVEEDANLDYDPFGAAEVALLASDNALAEAKANYSCPFRPSLPSTAYAQTRTSCVVKIIANLHVFVPNICEEQERDLFLQNFQKYLMSENPKQSVDQPNDFKATKVCINLGSLSDYAKTLIPNFLNEEDVQLLSDFSDKLQTWCKSQVGQVAQQVVHTDTPSERKEDLRPVQQPLPTQASTPDSNMNNLLKDVQNMEVSTPVPLTKPEGNAMDETPKNTRNGGFLQNAVGQDLVHLGVARTTSAGLSTVSSGVNSGHQRSKMDLDPASSNVDHFKTPELSKESGLQEDEKGESSMYDDRQPKRRKRTIMNDGQIDELEKALVEERDMHKNTVLLQNWSDKLSMQGPEITASQLKNWLNNRKAKLARIAKERGVPFEGESADKPSTPATPHPGESSESAGEDSYLPPARVMSAIAKGRLVSPDSSELTSSAEFSQNMMLSRPFTRSFSFEPGRLVSLVDGDGKEVGRGKIFHAPPGKSPTESRLCVVDVTELRIEKWRELPHPSEASGRTFQEAEARNGGVIRVPWDVVRLAPVGQ